MKCMNCNRELIPLGISLEDSELEQMMYAVNLQDTANTALKSNVVNSLNLTDSQVYTYFKTVYEQLATGNFLYWCFERDIRKKYNITAENIIVYNGEVYKHGDVQ